MVKLAYLCGEYPRATDTFIQREVAALRDEGFFVETLSVRRPVFRERGFSEQEEERNRTYYLLPCSIVKLIANHLGLFITSPVKYFSALKLAVNVRSPGIKSFIYQLFYFAEAGMVAARMKKNELVHIHNHAPDACGYVAMIASALGGFTYSMTLHGFGIFAEPERWRLKEKIENSLFSICISRHGLSQAMLWSSRTCWNKLHVVHCGIVPQEGPIRSHEGPGRNFLFIGRLDHVKGLPNLIEAFSRLLPSNPDVHLHIVGDGPERDDIESLISERKLGDKITLYGYKSQSELKDIFKDTDVFVMSSFFEGIPVVLMEAMLYGLPVIAPRITGIPELVEDNVCGILTFPGDPENLFESMKSLLNDPEMRNRFAAAGRDKVMNEFNLNTEIHRLTVVMHDYLG